MENKFSPEGIKKLRDRYPAGLFEHLEGAMMLAYGEGFNDAKILIKNTDPMNITTKKFSCECGTDLSCSLVMGHFIVNKCPTCISLSDFTAELMKKIKEVNQKRLS